MSKVNCSNHNYRFNCEKFNECYLDEIVIGMTKFDDMEIYVCESSEVEE